MNKRELELLKKEIQRTGQVPDYLLKKDKGYEIWRRKFFYVGVRQKLREAMKKIRRLKKVKASYTSENEWKQEIDCVRFIFWDDFLKMNPHFVNYLNLMRQWRHATFDQQLIFWYEPGPYHVEWMNKLYALLPEKLKAILPMSIFKGYE